MYLLLSLWIWLLSQPPWLGPQNHHLLQIHVPPMIHFMPQEEAWRIKPMIKKSQRALNQVLNELPDAQMPEIYVYWLPDIEDYFKLQNIPVRTPHWASGLAIPKISTLLVRIAPNEDNLKLNLHTTLIHELSHIALYHYTHGKKLPIWFAEGFAVYQSEDWSIERAAALIKASQGDTLIPLSKFDLAFPKDGIAAQLAYAESAHFIHWLIRRYGHQNWMNFLQLLHGKLPFEEAFQKSFGEPLAWVELVWLAGRRVPQSRWMGILQIIIYLSIFLSLSIALLIHLLRRKRKALKKWSTLDHDETQELLEIPKHLQNFGPFHHHYSDNPPAPRSDHE